MAVGYHPHLFLLIALVAGAELGLDAFLIHEYNIEGYPGDRFKALIDYIMFCSCWTFLFGMAYVLFIAGGAFHILASIASSAIWLIITAVFWGVAAGLFHNERGGSDCALAPAISRCRELQALEALAWTDFALCVVTLLAACCWVNSTRRPVTSPYYA